jgi:hypothetical protein
MGDDRFDMVILHIDMGYLVTLSIGPYTAVALHQPFLFVTAEGDVARAGGLLRATTRPTLNRRYIKKWTWVNAHRSDRQYESCPRVCMSMKVLKVLKLKRF